MIANNSPNGMKLRSTREAAIRYNKTGSQTHNTIKADDNRITTNPANPRNKQNDTMSFETSDESDVTEKKDISL